MIWKYYIYLVYLIFDKLLKKFHIIFLFIFTPNQNLWMQILATLKKGYKYLLKNLQIYEVIPIEVFVDMKKL